MWEAASRGTMLPLAGPPSSRSCLPECRQPRGSSLYLCLHGASTVRPPMRKPPVPLSLNTVERSTRA